MRTQRIIGIDVARALAVIGMIIVNFKVVFGKNGDSLLTSFASLFDGKASATFVVLAGVGLALMTNSAIQADNQEKLKQARQQILKRSIFLFVVGLSYIWVWSADILHFYGIYMLVALFFINKKPRQILSGSLLLILLYPLLIMSLDYEKGWDFSTLDYMNFWTVNGFIRNLFFNGFHPVIPWVAFMLFGLWYGRKNIHSNNFLKKSLWVSLSIFTIIQILSFGLIAYISSKNLMATEDLTLVLGTDPMPPMPVYMINGMSFSTVIISSCILLAERFKSNKIINALNKTGKLALTFYVAHVIIGMGLVEEFGSMNLGEYSIEFSVAYALVFSILCIVFAEIWLKFKKSGPLEWLMRRLTD